VADSVVGPQSDIKTLEQSGVIKRLAEDVGAGGDLAYMGIEKLHPHGQGVRPRRKSRGKDRPPEDIAFNRAFSRRRIVVEHTIGRIRTYESLAQAVLRFVWCVGSAICNGSSIADQHGAVTHRVINSWCGKWWIGSPSCRRRAINQLVDETSKSHSLSRPPVQLAYLQAALAAWKCSRRL
jgi:hypothetical protein